MSMETPQTCGRGLAEHSALPAKLAELTEALAVVLELHMKALDLSDPVSTKELEAYRQLANAHRDAAAKLHSIGKEMAGYRDLPMGRHDPKAMASPAAADAFERFVRLEEQLLDLLERRLEQHQEILSQMHAASEAP
jgi:hypothetical protein